MNDMFGKNMEIGHIAAVRYVWNSYVGEITLCGLAATGAMRHAFNSPHQIQKQFTYQVIGHVNPEHKDFNSEVFDWYNSETQGYKCPVNIRIYSNVEVPNQITIQYAS